MAAPTFVDADVHQGFADTSQVNFDWATVTGEADDDIAYAYIYKESTAAYTATPGTWTQVTGFPVDVDTGGFKYRADLWWRRRAGDAGTASWTWSGGTWAGLAGMVWRTALTGENPNITISLDEETSQNTQPSNPGLTIARSNSALLFFIWNFASATSTGPSGFAERIDADVWAYDDLTTATGASGAVAATLTNPEYAFSALIELGSEAAGGAAISPARAELVLQAVNRASTY